METTSDRTIKITVKPEIDARAIEEAARLAADYFLSSFAAAIVGATSTCRDHPQCDGYATCRRCGRGISGDPQCCPVEEKP